MSLVPMELLTITEVAAELKCSRQTIRNLINAGKLEVFQIAESSKSDRIDRRELNRYLMDQRRNRGLIGKQVFRVVKSPRPDVSADLDRWLGTGRKPKKKG